MKANTNIEFSVLDFGETDRSEEGVFDVLNYAKQVETLGYTRFWMGEHYIRNTLFSNPEPLIPTIAMATKRISVGVAGLLIRQHSIHRVACSFSLIETLFAGRIDLGLVAPSSRPDLKPDSLSKAMSTKAIFEEVVDYFQKSDTPGIYPGSFPRLWHLTTSIHSYVSCEHTNTVNLAKSLFHHNSNFDAEIDQINRLKDKFSKKLHRPMISIGIGCFVSNDQQVLTKYRSFYKSLLTEDLYNISILETPEIFLQRIREIALKYQTNHVVIVNLGRSYIDKIECLINISEIFSLKNA